MQNLNFNCTEIYFHVFWSSAFTLAPTEMSELGSTRELSFDNEFPRRRCCLIKDKTKQCLDMVIPLLKRYST